MLVDKHCTRWDESKKNLLQQSSWGWESPHTVTDKSSELRPRSKRIWTLVVLLCALSDLYPYGKYEHSSTHPQLWVNYKDGFGIK